MNPSSQNPVLSSMTGYGMKQTIEDQVVFRCEIRSVNSKYLEVNVRGPRELLFLEHRIASLVKGRLERGKVDVFFDANFPKSILGLEHVEKKVAGPEVDRYLNLYAELEKKVRHRGFVVRPLDLQRLLSDMQVGDRSGSVDVQGSIEGSSDPNTGDFVEKGVFRVLEEALEALIKVRQKEGEALCEALREPFELLQKDAQNLLDSHESIRSDLKEQNRKRLLAAVEALELVGDPQGRRSKEERIMLELALIQDKQDIAEEITRLHVHLRQMAGLIGWEVPHAAQDLKNPINGSDKPAGKDGDGAVSSSKKSPGYGKKLDFLCQEMFREINTMSNKLLQVQVLEKTLHMKQQVERIRQQVQNIE